MTLLEAMKPINRLVRSTPELKRLTEGGRSAESLLKIILDTLGHCYLLTPGILTIYSSNTVHGSYPIVHLHINDKFWLIITGLYHFSEWKLNQLSLIVKDHMVPKSKTLNK